MSGFAFKSKRVAEALRDSVTGQVRLPTIAPALETTQALIFEAPGGGIAARSGTTLGKADCTPYYIDIDATTGAGTLTELTDDAGNSQSFTVYNYVSQSITAGAYFKGVKLFNVWVTTSQDCG